jgi:hypothetical protein
MSTARPADVEPDRALPVMGLYAYAVVASDRTDLPQVDGVAPGPLGLVGVGPVAAVAGPVDVAQFEGEVLERNLADAGWLEAVVRGHERVVEALLGPDAVLPMRFGSIFSGPDALRDMLGGNVAALVELLDDVRGRVELGVTVRAERGTEPDDQAEASPSGRDYLRRRQAALTAARQVADASADLAARLHTALSGAAERAAVLSPHRSDPDLVLTAAYLVPDRAVDDFCRNVEAVGREHGAGCALEVTGPWPPYSFMSIDVSGPRG